MQASRLRLRAFTASLSTLPRLTLLRHLRHFRHLLTRRQSWARSRHSGHESKDEGLQAVLAHTIGSRVLGFVAIEGHGSKAKSSVRSGALCSRIFSMQLILHCWEMQYSACGHLMPRSFALAIHRLAFDLESPYELPANHTLEFSGLKGARPTCDYAGMGVTGTRLQSAYLLVSASLDQI